MYEAPSSENIVLQRWIQEFLIWGVQTLIQRTLLQPFCNKLLLLFPPPPLPPRKLRLHQHVD